VPYLSERTRHAAGNVGADIDCFKCQRWQQQKYASVLFVYLLQRELLPCCLTVTREPDFNTGSVSSLLTVLCLHCCWTSVCSESCCRLVGLVLLVCPVPLLHGLVHILFDVVHSDFCFCCRGKLYEDRLRSFRIIHVPCIKHVIHIISTKCAYG
jgi:hypothetical protein